MDDAMAARLPSDRKFGIVFTIFLCVVGVSGALRHWSSTAYAAALIGASIAGVITITVPSKLRALNKGWFYLGEVMGKIVSPVVLGIIFFGLLTPIALITRLFGRDELRLRSRAAGTYWIHRNASRSMAESFENQF